MVTYTTTNLLANIKTVAHVPQGNATFTAGELLMLADMEMRTGVAPRIASCRENYWLTTKRYPRGDNNLYQIPSKAQGSAIVDVKIAVSGNYIHLIRLEVGDLYSENYSNMPSYGYIVEDATIKIVPDTISGERVIWYYRIPSKLVPVTECGQITEIDGNEVTVGTLPSSFITGGELDVVSQQPGFNVLIKDSEPVSIVGNAITFDEVPDTVAVGDYVCLSGQSCVVQCPLEWVEILVQRVAVKIYEIQGYDKKQAMSRKVLDLMEQQAMNLVSPRTIENSKVIMGGGSLLMPQNMGWLPVRNN
jgi:hypothetical protein